MSKDDIDTETILAPRIKAVTNKPLLGMTLGTDGSWSARFWNKSKPKIYVRNWCQTVRVIRSKSSITYDDRQMPAPLFDGKFVRTISAWGKKSKYIFQD